MKILISVEELTMMLLAVFGLYHLQVAWWCYLLLLAGPDISMLGYLINNKTGAGLYNIFHHKSIAILLFVIGFWIPADALMITGLILFGHSALDWMLGYGLKRNEGFNYTHLGLIGKKKYEER